MKHLKAVTKNTPGRAEQWQEFVCYGSQMMGDLIIAIGGSKPVLGFVEEKCNLPEQS